MMNVVVTNCQVVYGKEDPAGNKDAFKCVPDHGFPNRVVFRTWANIIYVRKAGNKKSVEFKLSCEKEQHYFAIKQWRGISLGGDETVKRTVEISLKDGDSIYVWPG